MRLLKFYKYHLGSSKSCQTLKALSEKTPRKVLLRQQLKTEKEARLKAEKTILGLSHQLTEFNTVDNFLSLCEQHLSPSVLTIVKSHMMCKTRNPHGYRYTNDMKQLALTIYFLGPSVYRFLKSTLSLPSVRTLRRVTSKYDLIPGLNDFLFEFVKFKISNFKTEALDCILCADEMSLKTHLYYSLPKDEIIGFHQTNLTKTYEAAKYALVLMIRGINVSWKQPIAYFFVSGSCRNLDLSDIIMSTIKKLLNISLNVKAFVTDQGSNFVSFSKSVYVSPQRPYFTVNGKEIVYLFDPPHLLKSTRNMFFKHNFSIDDELTDNKYIIQFYNEDSKLNLRLAPKLTHAHINPGPFEKMRVYLAAQVFSESVAAGMNTHLELGKLPLESKCTIDVIDKMDKLFDIFNSCKVPNSKSFRRPFKNTSIQMEHLSMMISFFKKLKVISKISGTDVTSRMNFINGWLISINGLLKLWVSLCESTTHPSDYVLFTNRLNQDCLENLFGMFRNKNGNNRNPTPVQFYIAFRNLFCLNYFQYSPNANCIKDLDDILCHMNSSEVGITNVVLPEPSPRGTYFNFKIGTVDYRHLNLPEKNALHYVCGYLYSKCLGQHTCDLCVDYGRYQTNLDQAFLLCYFKAYTNTAQTTYGNLQMPNDDFYQFIFELENIFVQRFPLLAVGKGISSNLNEFLCNVPFKHPCLNFDYVYLIKLFVRFRIFSSVKFLNRELVSERQFKNRKLTILKHL